MLLASFVCVGACIPVGGFDGDIDGNAMPIQVTGLFGSANADDITFTQIIGLSFFVPCDRYAQWAEDRTDIMSDFAKSDHSDDDVEDAAADLDKIDVELGVPEEWWSVTISIFDDDDLEDNDFDAFGETAALVSVHFDHQTERADYEKLLKKGEDPNVDSFRAIDGELTLEDVVEETSLRVTTDELDLADAEDVSEDGADAKSVGGGTLTLSAAHCADLSDVIDNVLDDLNVVVDPPPVGEGEGEDDGDVDEPPPDPPSEPGTGGQTGSCSGLLGTDDGCDCGCGTFDIDCESTASDACEFNQCVSGAPSPTNNASCS
jgi:hypothetical protein